ncbi:MAG: MBL fold metallo-hydrolase [Desulfobacterales bacterium]|nr:MBL fold metallo-hydrolase [Desulfobacterales bacterium]
MVKEFLKKIHWLGHDAFRINSTKTIYMDPYKISGGPQADIILISHEHYDHCSVDDVAKIQRNNTIIVTEKQSAKKLSGDIRILSPGQSISLDDVLIEAVPAYNVDKQFHPKKNNWLGFIVEIDGIRIYHAGDSDFIPEMKGLHVDIALVPVSGIYVMDPKQAVEAVLAIQPKIAIPMHYGDIVGTLEDAKQFQQALKGKMDVVILEKTS